MTTAISVADVARRYLGTPWRHNGADATGVDCLGLVICVARDLGLPFPDFSYSPLPDLALFAVLPDYCRRISSTEAGAIVRLSVAGRPQHLAIVGDHPCGGLSLIHAYMPLGRVVEHRMDERWNRRVISAWRLGAD